MCLRRRPRLGVEAPQRRFGIETLADTVDVEGVIAAMGGKRTVAVRAETVAILVAMVRIDAQAGVPVGMKRAKIQPAPSTWPGAIEAQQLHEVVGLIELGDGDCCAMPLPGSFRKW